MNYNVRKRKTNEIDALQNIIKAKIEILVIVMQSKCIKISYIKAQNVKIQENILSVAEE